MRAILKYSVIVSLSINIFCSFAAADSSILVPVPHEHQNQSNWCWAAASRSVLRYYMRLPVISQEGIADYVTGGANIPTPLY